jgi:hypothetical protein
MRRTADLELKAHARCGGTRLRGVKNERLDPNSGLTPIPAVEGLAIEAFLP